MARHELVSCPTLKQHVLSCSAPPSHMNSGFKDIYLRTQPWNCFLTEPETAAFRAICLQVRLADGRKAFQHTRPCSTHLILLRVEHPVSRLLRGYATSHFLSGQYVFIGAWKTFASRCVLPNCRLVPCLDLPCRDREASAS